MTRRDPAAQPLPSKRRERQPRTQNGRFAKDTMAAIAAKEAMDLKVKGWTWGRIAEQCGYETRAGAYNAVNRLLAQETHGTSKHYRRVQLARLEKLIEHIEEMLYPGDDGYVDPEIWLKAVAQYKGLLERQAKLMGADVEVLGGESLTAPTIREYPQGVAEAV